MQLDNYDLSTIHYALFYYMDNANLDEDEMEWIGLLRDCLLYTSPSPRD